jgi:radical SAM superfamily enzyme YgiQ (UPF0313 family)
MLPKNWERRLLDLNVEGLRESDLEWADVVFLSAMIVQKESLKEVIDKCKALGKRVVVGGSYVSTSIDTTGADHVFVGEVEESLPEFLKDLERGQAKKVYQIDTKPGLSLTPVPDFSIAKLDKYSAMSVQYSRGCPFNCEFCDIIEIYGRVPRTKSNHQMFAELEALKKAGWQGLVFIVDDNFIGNKKNVRKFIPELIEWSEQNDFPFSFITEASINLAEDEKLMEMMQRAGFRRVFLGIETPVEATLKETQKGQNTRRNLLESVEKIQSYGMEVMGGFIVGFDNDPKDIFKQQIEFIRESAIPLAMVGLLNALPDTQLWRRLEKEGRLLQGSTGDNTDASLNFVPKMDTKYLIKGYKQILKTIYQPGEYYQRTLKCLSRIKGETVHIHYSNLLTEIRSLIRLVLKLGVLDKERKEFWRYFRQVLANHRESFSHAMVLAAMGYHFRQLTEDLNG